MTENNDFLLFEFETPSEFALYCKHFQNVIKNRRVIWSTGTDYKDLCKIGYEYLDSCYYTPAEFAFNKAMEFNPIGLEARFGLAEVSINNSHFKDARERLLSMKDYIYSASLAGRFYRRLGYIYAEEGNCDLAYACVLRSKKYDDCESADEEIEYIKSKGQVNESAATVEFLSANNIPLLGDKNNRYPEDITAVNSAYETIRALRKTPYKAHSNEEILQEDGMTHLSKLNEAYERLDPQTVNAYFPKGKAQANRILKSLAQLYNLDLDECDSDEYYDILESYKNMVYNKVVREVSNDTFIKAVPERFSYFVEDAETAKKVLAFIMLSIHDPEYILEEDDTVLSAMAASYTYAEKKRHENEGAETKFFDDPEYGLVVTKPIYTNGVTESKKYVNALKTDTGKTLNWVRRGPTTAPGINGIIDIYDSYLSSGKLYKTIYVNMYGSSVSTVIPKGFSR